MTKKSASRKMKDAQAAGKAPASRQVYLAPTAMIHPMFKTKLNEIKAEQVKEESVPVWDEVNALYVKAAQGVMSPVVLGQLAKRKDIIAHIRDQDGLQTRVGMFQRDILALKTELSQLAAEHAGKAGSEDDPAEIMRAISIGEKYALFMEKLEATIPPTVAHILEIFTEAELIMQQKAQDASNATHAAEQDARIAELDPTVVTDVDAKDVPNDAPAIADPDLLAARVQHDVDAAVAKATV